MFAKHLSTFKLFLFVPTLVCFFGSIVTPPTLAGNGGGGTLGASPPTPKCYRRHGVDQNGIRIQWWTDGNGN